MPEMRFRVRWPDDSTSDCYSPSHVVQDYFVVGQRYTVPDFVERCRAALNLASERVRAKYGFACSSALDQLGQIESIAAGFDATAPAGVLVESFT